MNAINICEIEGFPIIGSPILKIEISRIPDDKTRKTVMGFYTNTVTKKTAMSVEAEARASTLQAGGLRKMDSYHTALAESAGVVYLLTTDPKFVNAAKKLDMKVKVINPIEFLQEYIKWLEMSV